MHNWQKYAAVIYIIVLVLFVFYAKDVLKREPIIVRQQEEESPVPEVKPVKVSLQVHSDLGLKTYEYDLTTQDTVLILLEKARERGDIYFETYEYTEHHEYHFFETNGTYDKRWSVFYGDTEITNSLKDFSLKEADTFVLMRKN